MKGLAHSLVVKRLKSRVKQKVLLYLFIGIKLLFNTSFLITIYEFVCHTYRFTVVDLKSIIIQNRLKVNEQNDQ